MTTERLREPRRAADAINTVVGTGDGRAVVLDRTAGLHRPGHGACSGKRAATVTVMPLWARPRAGVRG
ncbi:hypothetical protein SAMN06272781_3082 [Streptomyces sp. 1222.2]|uniref:Uncharacterized protein n=1 Tax=Streptomyces stelliscabiei TaxID=146820 RepID=A0A8I0P4R2_9ACTN|nr:hypothetical protein [Streptomyces stelliscabiei]MBE1599518.1 hypothetical protein [Streptomyces stelliscabiei]SOD75244.1 hypothetical protein SAMN06272781_3082 [Streptomyces sp. 1222.2]